MAVAPAQGQTPKRGGILNAMLAEDPPGLSIHESAKQYFAQRPHVKNLIPRNSLSDYGRMQEVWLDR